MSWRIQGEIWTGNGVSWNHLTIACTGRRCAPQLMLSIWRHKERSMLLGMALKGLAVWAVILMLAVLNGALREAVLIPKLGTPVGLVLSGVFLSALILVVAYLSLPWLGARRSVQLVGIGLGWLALTLIFEFSFGLWQGKSWQVMLGAYTFKGGNIWPVVLVVTALAPYLAAKLRGLAYCRMKLCSKSLICGAKKFSRCVLGQ